VDSFRPSETRASPVRPFLHEADGGIAEHVNAQHTGTQRAASPVRPYILTGGRAGPSNVALEVEAQVVTTAAGAADLGRHSYETYAIIEICQRPMAVAEVAARLDLHLGVARVLVGDLLIAGDLSVRRPEAGMHRNAQIIERVIRGLQAIR
jgi:uncharacterized protein DUF742